ncbi:hypothetical protein [Aeromicrobium sp. 179-A 4D2 NHS]|uniref:hypothetical protein n=1 Tax=Aeromicrobium sp. 179-A 4D2 NHS TaxID=3142375 RepID=UPI00399FEB6D
MTYETKTVDRDTFTTLKGAQQRAFSGMGIDHDPVYDEKVSYYHGDDRDFIDVAWDLKHAGIIDTVKFVPAEPDPDAKFTEEVDVCHVISTAFRNSTAVKHLIALEAARLILDSERLNTILDQVPEAAERARAEADKDRALYDGAATYLVAQVATLIRDTPASKDAHKVLSALAKQETTVS